jgi:type II secretory pathway pseudopilin PulG
MTFVEVLAVVVMLFVLAAILLPTGPHAGNKARRINCSNNLKQIGLAFRIWQGDNGNKFPMGISATNAGAMKLINSGKTYVLWQMMSNELSTPKILYCPADTDHVIATSFSSRFSDANISYFFGLDVTTNDTQMILDGDDNLAVNGARVPPGLLNLRTNTPVAWTKERHHFVGFLGLADGSVQATASAGLSSALVSSGTATNRLVIP